MTTMKKTDQKTEGDASKNMAWSTAQCWLFYSIYAIAAATFVMTTKDVLVNMRLSAIIKMTPTFLEKIFGVIYLMPIAPALISATIVCMMFIWHQNLVRHGRISMDAPSRAFCFHGLAIFFGVTLVFDLTWILQDTITGRYTHAGVIYVNFLIITMFVLFTMSTGFSWAQRIAQNPIHSKKHACLNFLAPWGVMVILLISATLSTFSTKQIDAAHKDMNYAKILSPNKGNALDDKLSKILSKTPVPDTLYISQDGRHLRKTAKEGFLPVTLKVTGPKSCQLCHFATSPPILRVILFRHHLENAHGGGWCLEFHLSPKNTATPKKDVPVSPENKP
jgi:hypothetical protein